MRKLQSYVRCAEETVSNAKGAEDSGEDRGAIEFDMEDPDTGRLGADEGWVRMGTTSGVVCGGSQLANCKSSDVGGIKGDPWGLRIE